jgi:hypothetical protein
LPAATWSSIWYLLSSFAVISYTNNWFYVLFAATGSWIGAYLSLTFLAPIVDESAATSRTDGGLSDFEGLNRHGGTPLALKK